MQSVFLNFLKSALLKRVVLIALKELAKRSDNKVDDQIVSELEKVLG